MNTRRLAGSRRNKHLPIARTTRRSDRLPQLCEAASVRWLAARDGMGRTFAALFHNPAQGSKPDHAARAVDIRTIWPPLTLNDSTAKQRRAAEAGARGKSAAPKGYEHRKASYLRANDSYRLTARQSRQLVRQQRRQAFAAL